MAHPRVTSALAIALVLGAPVATAEPREEPTPAANEDKLARDIQNPVSNLSSVFFQNQTEFGIGPYNRVRNTLSLLPTVAISVTRDVAIISRTKLPFVSRPDVQQANGFTSGLGDIIETAFIVPNATAEVVWGVGPSLLLPTATPSELGSGKFGVGPTAAVVFRPKPLAFGAVGAQTWSVAGASDRRDVNQLTLMPVVIYNLPRGWYLNTSPVITANWNVSSTADTWTVPVGGGAGKVVVVDDVPLNVSAAAYWNVLRPDTAFAPSMTAQLQVAILLPK
ncbi:MAG TPA: hypothetical protein VM925_00290 [Labilithrix sp.]|nr:hypothetical protein [Labilithrix sp.]